MPVRLLQVLAERIVPPPQESTGLSTWQGGESLARGLASVLEWDGRIALALLSLGIPVPGLSNFAVCRPFA
ncbi:MAG: hypothetical protein U0Q11_13630 [Vicinamibacterales bacterium]